MSKTSIEWTEKNQIVDERGYVMVYMPEHHSTKDGRYVYVHRLVMEEVLGRPLTENENIHHKNGDKSDNRPQNLEIMSNSEHMSKHYKGLSEEEKQRRTDMLVRAAKERKVDRVEKLCECGCGCKIISPDSRGRERRFVHGHNQRGRTWTWEDDDGKN